MTARRPWNPDEVARWRLVVRDGIAYVLAVFLILYASLNAVAFGTTILGAMFGLAALLLGLPHALRRDSSRGDDDSP